MVLRLLLVWMHGVFLQTRTARLEERNIFRAEGRLMECPGAVPRCYEFEDWIKFQRKEGRCLPQSTSNVQCSLGAVPTNNGFQMWKPGQPCEAYYEQKICTMRNTPFVAPKDGHSFGSGCTQPKLRVQDCRNLANATEAGEDSSLVDTMRDVIRRGPDEWVWLPSSRMALHAASGILETFVIDSLADNGSVIVEKAIGRSLPLWHMMLYFCTRCKWLFLEQAKRSGSRIEQKFTLRIAEGKALEDCKEVTRLDSFAPYNPSWVVLQQNFKGYDDLAAIKQVGVFDLDESLWRQLAVLSGGDADETMKKLTSKVGELVLNAGDRGEEELELALSVSATSLAGGVKPLGGKRRLMEMRVLRQLRVVVNEVVKKTTLEDAVNAAASLLEFGEVHWVTGFDEIYAAARRKLEAWGLEEACAEAGLPFPCTQKEIDAKQCTELQLPPTCTKAERDAALALIRECLELRLHKNCTVKDIEEKRAFMIKCTEWGLDEMCTQQDIWNARALKKKCVELGFETDCSQDQVDFAARCEFLGLPHTCTQEDIDSMVTTTTTTTLAHCSITERFRNSRFGVSFGFYFKQMPCNRVLCNPIHFFATDIYGFLNATVKGKKCECEFVNHYSHSFHYMNWQGNCGPRGCWQEYARDLMHSKHFHIRADWQRLDNADHWTGQCVQEEEALTKIPEVRNAFF